MRKATVGYTSIVAGGVHSPHVAFKLPHTRTGGSQERARAYTPTLLSVGVSHR